MEWPAITLVDVLEAKRRIAPHLRPTPLYPYAGLDELLDAEVWVKHENHQPVGAFKVRGGVNLVSQLGEDERAARPDRRLDREPRPVGRLRRAALRRHGPHLRAGGRQPGEARGDAGARRGADRARARTSTRPASTASGWRPSTATATSTRGTSRT